jgi:hypothetical protein
MVTVARRFLMLAVIIALLAGCATSTPSPTPTAIPTEPPTSTEVPPTATATLSHVTPVPPTLSPDAKPGLSNLRFATSQDLTDAHADNALFEVGVSDVWVAVDYRDLPPNTELNWRMQGGNIEGSKKQPLTGTSGTAVYNLFGSEHVALPGDYRITVRTSKQVLNAAFSISAESLEPGEVIIIDRFDNNALGWDLSSSPISSAEIGDDHLKLAVNWKNQYIATSAPFLLSDFDLSIDMLYEEVPADSFVTIRFWQEYTLDLFVDGRIVVKRFDGQDFTVLLAAAPESSFQPNGVNKVRITAHDDSLVFYRNGVALGALSQQSEKAGLIELSATTLDKGGLVVLFDNFEVRLPN